MHVGIRSVTGGRRLAAASLVATLTVSGVLSSCSGDSDTSSAEASDSPSATIPVPSATPRESATLEPKPPKAPPRKDTQKSRKAFTRYVIASWRHALLTNDPSSVTRISGKKSCRGCKQLRRELSTREKEGWYVELPPVRVKDITVTRLAKKRTWLARAKVDIPPSTSYFETGVARNNNERRPNATFQVIMRLEKKRYTLVGYFLR